MSLFGSLLVSQLGLATSHSASLAEPQERSPVLVAPAAVPAPRARAPLPGWHGRCTHGGAAHASPGEHRGRGSFADFWLREVRREPWPEEPWTVSRPSLPAQTADGSSRAEKEKLSLLTDASAFL